MKCVMKELDLHILNPINNRKGLISVPANNLLLRLISILRKTFKMRTTVKLVTECPDKVEKHGFNKMSMELTPVAMVVSAA